MWQEGVTCPPGVDHVATAELEVGSGHVTPAETEVGAGHVTIAKPEVTHLAPSRIPVGAIMARVLMTLMRTTCVGLGGSHVWRGGSLASLGLFT